METTALTFGQPQWLWALAVIPAGALLYFWSQRRSQMLVARIVAPRLREQLAGAVSVGRRVLKAVLILSSIALIIVALAKPRTGFIQREVKQKGRDVVIAVDTSRSMLATDVTPTRLARAKLFSQDLLNLLEGDRVGLVAFAGSAFLQAPLTLDHSAVLNALEELDTDLIPKGGTNIATAIATAEQAFGKAEGKTRALIIITDGEELDADGIAAAKSAEKNGLRIFTVGVGSREGSLIPIRDTKGRSDFVRDDQGKPVKSQLDQARLKEIAEATGGFYEALGADTAKIIFDRGINPMELTEGSSQSSRQPIERYQVPLTAAIVLLIFWMFLGDRKWNASRSRKNGAKVLHAIVFLFAFTNICLARSGYDEYQAGQYDKAKEDFQRRLESLPDFDKLQFDAGATAYKLGEFDQAVGHFTKALLSEDEKLRQEASYNLANSLVRRGESEKEKEGKRANWKSAIEHYSEVLNLDAGNTRAKENRGIVEKMLKDLDKEEQKKEDQKKDQKQDQKKDQKQDQKDQQKQDQKDQQQKDQKKEDQQKQDQKDGQQDKDQQKKDQEKQNDPGKGENSKKQDQPKPDEKKDQQDGKDKQDQPKDSNGQDQDKKQDPGQKSNDSKQEMAKNQDSNKDQPAPIPTPGEKKQGEIKSKPDEQKNGQETEAKEAEEGEEKDGAMSVAQARALLNAMKSEDEKVRLMERRSSQDVFKDW